MQAGVNETEPQWPQVGRRVDAQVDALGLMGRFLLSTFSGNGHSEVDPVPPVICTRISEIVELLSAATLDTVPNNTVHGNRDSNSMLRLEILFHHPSVLGFPC